jgi:hypothetical protein
MTMNKHLVSFTWSALRLSSLCGLALALTGMTQAKTAKACYQCVSIDNGSYWMCQSTTSGSTTCVGGGLRQCSVSGSCR